MLVALRRLSSAPAPTSTCTQVYSSEYNVAFHKAMATFKHQTIFDLNTRSVSRTCSALTVLQSTRQTDVGPSTTDTSLSLTLSLSHSLSLTLSLSQTRHLSPLTLCELPSCLQSLWGEGNSFSFLGNLLPPDLACGIADGLIDPTILVRSDCLSVCVVVCVHVSVCAYASVCVSICLCACLWV